MGKRMDPVKKAELLRKYIEDGATAPDLSREYGVSVTAIYQWAKDGLPEVATEAQGEGQEQTATPASPQVSTQPIQQVRISNPVPLFPSTRQNQIENIKITRVLANPKSAETGFIGMFDPYLDEQAIQGIFGGGRYDVRAVNSQGIELGRKILVLSGRSKAFNTDEPDEAEEITMIERPTAPTGSNGEVLMMIRDMKNDHARQIEQMQSNADRAINEAKSSGDRYVQMMQSNMEGQIRQQQSFFENMFKLQQPRKEESLRDKLEELTMLKELMGDKDSGADSVTTALQKAPEIIQAAANLIHGPQNDPFEDDEPDELGEGGEEQEEVEGEEEEQEGEAPQSNVKPRGPVPLKQIAIELIRNRVAAGMSVEEAKRMVMTGLQFMKQHEESLKPKVAKVIVAAKETLHDARSAKVPDGSSGPAPTKELPAQTPVIDKEVTRKVKVPAKAKNGATKPEVKVDTKPVVAVA